MNTTIGAEVCWALSPPLSPLDSRLLFLVHWHFVIFFSLLLLLCAQVNDSTDELRLYVCEQGEIVWSVSKKVLLIYTPSTKNSLAISTSHIYICCCVCTYWTIFRHCCEKKICASDPQNNTLYKKELRQPKKKKNLALLLMNSVTAVLIMRKERTHFFRANVR